MNKQTIVESFVGLNLDDLNEIKEALTAIIKSRKEEAKIAEKEAKELAKAEAASHKTELAVGMVVSFTYKGTVKTGTIVKMTDKTFHINRGEALLDGDENKSAFIAFDKLVAIVSAAA